VPSKGIRKGVVVNVGEVTAAIIESVQRAERTSGYAIASAYVGLAGAHISSINSRGVVAISRGERGIRPVDVERALEQARAIDIPHNREILHIIPRGFTSMATRVCVTQLACRLPLGGRGAYCYRLYVVNP
jgi:cell division protein FtsA